MATMVFSTVFERFVASCPACVMFRALMENLFSPAKLDALFHRAAEKQYQRELLFSTVVDLVSQVVTRSSKSVHAAYVEARAKICVSVRALYDKLDHVEPCTSRALVQHTAHEVTELIDCMKGGCEPLLKGYRVRILDGNHLGKTEHRIGVLRKTAAGALPGQSLVLLDPQRMVIEDVIPCEDAHAQERTLLTEVLPTIRPRDLLIDDRNFCTLAFLFAVRARRGFFITRQHGRMPWTPLGKRRFFGRVETGKVYEQNIELRDPVTGEITRFRRITVALKKSTRDGDTEIHLLTNLPRSRVSAAKVAELYRKRWTLEAAFNELTLHLRCELNTLGYPKAALFAFCVAVSCYNLLAAIKGALRGVHGEEVIKNEVSNYFLTDEINGNYRGMMIALPPEEWEVFQTLSTVALAAQLSRWARKADLRRYPRNPRGPKKPVQKRPNAQFQHVSTWKLLEERRQQKPTNRMLVTETS
jgi:Transposase DDE domain